MTAPPADQVLRRGFVAGFVSRAMAYVIDGLVVTLVVSVTTSLAVSIAGVFDVDLGEANSNADALVLAGIALTVTWGYFVLGWWLFGKTIGKMALGLRVVRPDGERPRLRHAVLRLIGYAISAAVFFMGFIWIAFDPRRRGWHDYLAGTYVVYDWDARPRALLDLGDDEAVRPWL